MTNINYALLQTDFVILYNKIRVDERLRDDFVAFLRITGKQLITCLELEFWGVYYFGKIISKSTDYSIGRTW